MKYTHLHFRGLVEDVSSLVVEPVASLALVAPVEDAVLLPGLEPRRQPLSGRPRRRGGGQQPFLGTPSEVRRSVPEHDRRCRQFAYLLDLHGVRVGNAPHRRLTGDVTHRRSDQSGQSEREEEPGPVVVTVPLVPLQEEALARVPPRVLDVPVG